MSVLRRHTCLGEVNVDLENLDLSRETHLWREVTPPEKIKEEIRGELQVSLCFQPCIEQLLVTIHRAKDLPQGSFSGMPDTYAKVIVSQLSGSFEKKTKVQKRTTNPVFDETLSFKLSPKRSDLQFTIVLIQIMAERGLLKDEVMGHVQLGYGATSDSGFKQWESALQNSNAKCVEWHRITADDD